MTDNTLDSANTGQPEPAATAATAKADIYEPGAEDYAALEAEFRTDAEEPDDEPGADDRDGDLGKARRDAAKYRARLRETETERDQLRDQLIAQRRAVIDWRAASAPTGAVDAALLDAASIDVDSLLDESGQLDMTAVDEFIDNTAKRFKIARGFAPNRAQGHAGSGADAAPKSLADAFRRR